jgi:CheY-like chemotaxis protein
MSRTMVLVVEDEVLIRLSLVEQLEDAGFAVLEASDAESAIRVLEAPQRNPLGVYGRSDARHHGWHAVGALRSQTLAANSYRDLLRK